MWRILLTAALCLSLTSTVQAREETGQGVEEGASWSWSQLAPDWLSAVLETLGIHADSESAERETLNSRNTGDLAEPPSPEGPLMDSEDEPPADSVPDLTGWIDPIG